MELPDEPTATPEQALAQMVIIQENVEQQLDEIQDALVAVRTILQRLDNETRNSRADMQQLKKALNVP